jgi:hypothetical protein
VFVGRAYLLNYSPCDRSGRDGFWRFGGGIARVPLMLGLFSHLPGVRPRHSRLISGWSPLALLAISARPRGVRHGSRIFIARLLVIAVGLGLGMTVAISSWTYVLAVGISIAGGGAFLLGAVDPAFRGLMTQIHAAIRPTAGGTGSA